MTCCQPFEGSAHHPFCKNNAFVSYPSVDMHEFKHIEDEAQYCVYNPDVIMDWTLKNLGCIMAMNGRPLSVEYNHVMASLETASKIVTLRNNNELKGFAILQPKALMMRNKFKMMIGEVVKDKNTEVFVDTISVSVIYAVPGYGCDLMGFLCSIVPPKRALALQAVKGSEKFYKRIGMTKYGEDMKERDHLFVCQRNTFFPDVKVVFGAAKRNIVYPFPAGFDKHFEDLHKKPLDTLRLITGCPTPAVPTVHKSVSVFHTKCKACHMEQCLCGIDPDDFGDLPMPPSIGAGAGADFSFAAAEAYGASLKREAEEAAKRAAEFSDLFASTASARQSVADTEAKVSAAKQRAEAARAAAAAAQKAAEEAAEAARKAEAEEKDVHAALAAAVAANSAALRSLEVAVSRKRSRE